LSGVRIYFATHNKHKIEEVRYIAGKYGVIVEGPPPEWTNVPEEDGDTYPENAYKKAIDLYRLVRVPVIGEDSGLEVMALEGKPGVHSSRFAQMENFEGDNVECLLHKMKDIKARRATFICCVCLILNDRRVEFFWGSVEGWISHERVGAGGFGYDPVFIPEGYDTTFAVLGWEVKNNISHRAMAIRKLCEFLNPVRKQVRRGRCFPFMWRE